MKFRIFNRELQSFVDGNEWFIGADGTVYFHDFIDGMIPCSQCVYSRALERVDSYNKPIYYGDIVKCTKYSGNTYISNITISDVFDEVCITNGDYDTIEIIGNIWNNTPQ